MKARKHHSWTLTQVSADLSGQGCAEGPTGIYTPISSMPGWLEQCGGCTFPPEPGEVGTGCSPERPLHAEERSQRTARGRAAVSGAPCTTAELSGGVWSRGVKSSLGGNHELKWTPWPTC